MKLRKTAKDNQGLSLLDKAEGKLSRILEERDEANVKTRAFIKEQMAEREKIQAEIEKKTTAVDSLTKEYLSIQAELREKEKKALEEKSLLASDVKEKKISIREFLEHGISAGEVFAKAKAEAERKLQAPRDQIRQLRLEILELKVRLADLDEKIQRNKHKEAQHMFQALKFMADELEKSGIIGSTPQAAHFRKQEAENSLNLAKGAGLWHPMIWQLQTIEQLEALVLDPVVKEEHFPNLEKAISEIKGLGDFSSISLNYTPAAAFGRGAGAFWWSVRPPIGVIHE